MAGFEYGSFYTDEVIMARVMAYTENCQLLNIPISSYIYCGTQQEVYALYQIKGHVEDKSDRYYWNEAMKATIPVSGTVDDLDGGEPLDLKLAQEYVIKSGELKGSSHIGAALLAQSRSPRQQNADGIVMAGVESISALDVSLALEMQRYDKHCRLKTFLSAKDSAVTDDDLKALFDLPPGMIFKDLRKFRIALAEALVPESKRVDVLLPNPFQYNDTETRWSQKDSIDDNPSYEQFTVHYTIADPKPQLLKSIFGLQKVIKPSSSRSAENYNDPSSYSASAVDPLVIQNESLKRQVEHAQLLQSNKDLLRQLEKLNSSTHHSTKHHKRKNKRDAESDDDSSKENKKKSKKHSSHSSKYDNVAMADAQKSIDDID